MSASRIEPNFWDERIDLVLCRPADEQEDIAILRQARLQHEKAPVM